MSTPSSERHREAAARSGPVPIAVVTVSDTRTPEDDANGRYLRERIEAAGHRLVGYQLVRDEPTEVAFALHQLVAGEARMILFNGGTGFSPRDTTFDALDAKLERRIPGFGELFRMLSWEQVGSAAMLSRAVAGVYRGRVVVSLPGSPAAVRLAWERLLEPEIAHLVWQVAE
jgi:molybdenum cofactor biosynthesis protein B